MGSKGRALAFKKKGNRTIRYSVIALRNHKHKLVAPICYTGTLSKDLFKDYLTHALKQLPPESIIILDNASSHTHLKKEEELTKAQVQLKYLPPYSPQLNKIEQLWANIKCRLKQVFRDIQDNFKEALYHVLREYADPLEIYST